MKLLIIAPEAYPVPCAQGTSVETCIYNIAVNLARHHSVTVVSRSMPNLPRISIRGRLRIIRVPSGTKAGYMRSVLRAVGRQRFDQIQVDNRPGFLAAVRKRFPTTPLSIFLHSLNFITPPKTSVRRVRLQLFNADMIVVNSASLASRVEALYPDHGHKIQVVHLGVDTTKFRPPTAGERAHARRRLGVQRSFVISFVGRFIPLKGIPLLIKAAELVHKDIPTTKLILAGSGKRKYVSYLQALARRAKVPVHFLGQVTRSRMPMVYWAADCFVCPTQGHEAFGLVVVEALSSGVPTVASCNGGISEIITHNVNGLLVKSYRDPRRFAEAIATVAGERRIAQRLGTDGRSTCLRVFGWPGTSSSLARLYFGMGTMLEGRDDWRNDKHANDRQKQVAENQAATE